MLKTVLMIPTLLLNLLQDSSLMTSPHYRKMVNRPSTSESLRRIMYKLEGKLDCMMKETLRLNTEDENNIDAEYYFNDDEEDTDNGEPYCCFHLFYKTTG